MGKAQLEHVASVIRVWINSDAVHGDPYDWVATVRWINKATIEIMGITMSPNREIWAAVMNELLTYGVEEIVYYRYKDGQPVKKLKKCRAIKSLK